MIDDTITTHSTNEWKNKTFDRLRKQWCSYAPTKVHLMPTKISLEFMNAAWIEACACFACLLVVRITSPIASGCKHFDALNAGNNQIDDGILNARKSHPLCVHSHFRWMPKVFTVGFLATEKLSDNFLSHAERTTTKKNYDSHNCPFEQCSE